MDLQFFINDRYRILKLLYENEIKIKGELYAPLSQQEIADIAHFSKLKTNKILKELNINGYVVMYKNIRGKYKLTKKALNIINIIENTMVEG